MLPFHSKKVELCTERLDRSSKSLAPMSAASRHAHTVGATNATCVFGTAVPFSRQHRRSCGVKSQDLFAIHQDLKPLKLPPVMLILL